MSWVERLREMGPAAFDFDIQAYLDALRGEDEHYWGVRQIEAVEAAYGVSMKGVGIH
jgi:hypothetical protein